MKTAGYSSFSSLIRKSNMKPQYVYAGLAILGYTIFLNSLAWIVVTRTDAIAPEEDVFATYTKVTMKPSDAESVMAVISAEGFDNAFNHQSTFRDIGDAKFHELRKAYIAASQELMNYLADSAGKKDNIPYYMAHESRN